MTINSARSGSQARQRIRVGHHPHNPRLSPRDEAGFAGVLVLAEV
jgi:hypothetical protein